MERKRERKKELWKGRKKERKKELWKGRKKERKKERKKDARESDVRHAFFNATEPLLSFLSTNCN